MPPNKPLQRSGMDKVPGRGRGENVLEHVLRARVLMREWPAAERGCYAALEIHGTPAGHATLTSVREVTHG